MEIFFFNRNVSSIHLRLKPDRTEHTLKWRQSRSEASKNTLKSNYDLISKWSGKHTHTAGRMVRINGTDRGAGALPQINSTFEQLTIVSIMTGKVFTLHVCYFVRLCIFSLCVCMCLHACWGVCLLFLPLFLHFCGDLFRSPVRTAQILCYRELQSHR